MDQRDLAWLGDAVLALYARQWLVNQGIPMGATRHEQFVHLTCNQFLSGLGEPTQVEALIGRIYCEQGLEAAFRHIEAQLLPLYLRQRRQR
ncbi:MAG: hypothetical protein Q6J68_05035 [Thermostichales cyanobacterium SZTDM-1c_bins_54]